MGNADRPKGRARVSEPSTEDAFEPSYSPKKIDFWLAHFEELVTMVFDGKSSAHIAEHLQREWILLQSRMRSCLCGELHDADTRAVDPACAHMPQGGSYRHGPETALCIYADLRRAADLLPATWIVTHKIWTEQMLPGKEIQLRASRSLAREREPIFARGVALRRMARELGWQHADIPVTPLT